MSTRLDIELTSVRPDGTWTWRKDGARQPKGEVDASVLPAGVSVGDVLRAEVDVAIDGIDIVSVLPPKSPRRDKHDSITVIGSGRPEELVTTKLYGKGGRDRGERGDRGPRGDRGDRKGGGRPRRDDQGDARRGGPRGERDRGRPRSDGEGGATRTRAPRTPEPPRLKWLRPARTHRNAVLDGLAPEQRPIAEQVLMGGVPAVRQAIDKQNAQLRERGEAQIHGDELVALAEKLLPSLRSAEWRDRADAALATVEELDLRDLRSVVVAADSGARDDEGRALADQLRAALTRRVEEEHSRWLAELTLAVREGRTVRALRLSSRPPKAGAPLPAELTETLIAQVTENLTSETTSDRWVTVIDALSFSPVRAQVTPASLPETISDELKAAVAKLATRLPHIAAMLGVEAGAPRPRRPKKDRGPREPARPAAVAEPVDVPSTPEPAAPSEPELAEPEVAAEPEPSAVSEPAAAESEVPDEVPGG